MLSEMPEGSVFRTRLTGRPGMIMAHTPTKGVLIEWLDTHLQAFLHEAVLVDEVPGVLRAEGR